MTVIIPSRTTKKINQNNRSKILGDIWASFNIDLQSNLGAIKIYPRLQLNTGSVANQGISTAFKSFDQKIFALADTTLFFSSGFNLTSSFTEETSAKELDNFSANYSDIETFNNTLVLAGTNKILSKATNGSGGGSYTVRATLGATDSLHKLCYFTKFDRIYYIDNYHTIKSMSTSWSEATSSSYFISLDYKQGAPYTMDSDATDIWIGTINPSPSGVIESVGHASILRWDGISDQINQEYKVKAKGVLALCKDDRNIMHALTSDGQLLQFTGSGFEEIGRLPINQDYLINALAGSTIQYNAFIHPNGFYFTRNGTFIVLVNNLVGDSGGTIKENLPSGIWEFHKDTGFVHRQSLSYTPMGTSTITDYGQNRISQAGALYEADIYSSSATGKPMIICGANYYTDGASTTASGIFINDPLDAVQKYGYFVTSWFLSSNLREIWQKIALKYRQLLNTTDKIVLKYRTREASSTEISLTWSALSSTTATFTTSTDVSALTGYEVEVIQGTGSGKCAHIVSVTNNSGTYTVVLDEPFTGVTTGTAKARIQAWKRLASTSDQISTSESLIKTIAEGTAMRIQVKVCMQFTGENEVYELAVVSQPEEKLI